MTPAAKCEQVVGFKINEYGDVVDEIECIQPAACLVERALTCAECRDRIVADEPTFKVDPLHAAADAAEETNR